MVACSLCKRPFKDSKSFQIACVVTQISRDSLLVHCETSYIAINPYSFPVIAMRLLGGFVLSLLILTTKGVKKTTADRFQDFHSKALSSTPLKLVDTSYDRLTATPRDYSVAVLLTALESRFGCQLCREFQPEWELLAKSWTKGDRNGDSRLVYGTLDFVDGKNTFQSVCLCFQAARLVLIYCTAWSPNRSSPTSLSTHHWAPCYLGRWTG